MVKLAMNDHSTTAVPLGLEPTRSVDRTSDALKTINRLRRTAHVMDSAIRIPGTERRIGLDSLIGLIPGIGDVMTTIISAEFVRQAIRLGARKRIIAQMVANIGVDMLIGAIPLVGDIFDFAFKANVKNADLLEDEFLSKNVMDGQATRDRVEQ